MYNRFLVKVEALEEEATKSTLQAEKNKVKALEKETLQHDKERMDLRVRFTRKVKQVGKAEWDLEDANIGIAQSTEERDTALEDIEKYREATRGCLEELMASKKESKVERQRNPSYRTSADEDFQSIQEKLERSQRKNYQLSHAQMYHEDAIRRMQKKLDDMTQGESRLRQRLTEVITEGDAAIGAEREAKTENIRLRKRILILEKKEPGLYFDGLETVAAFEEKIARLENEKAHLALEKFEVIGSLASAMQEFRVTKGVEGPVGIRALVGASKRPDLF